MVQNICVIQNLRYLINLFSSTWIIARDVTQCKFFNKLFCYACFRGANMIVQSPLYLLHQHIFHPHLTPPHPKSWYYFPPHNYDAHSYLPMLPPSYPRDDRLHQTHTAPIHNLGWLSSILEHYLLTRRFGFTALHMSKWWHGDRYDWRCLCFFIFSRLVVESIVWGDDVFLM